MDSGEVAGNAKKAVGAGPRGERGGVEPSLVGPGPASVSTAVQ